MTNDNRYAGGKIALNPWRLWRTWTDGAVRSSIHAAAVCRSIPKSIRLPPEEQFSMESDGYFCRRVSKIW